MVYRLSPENVRRPRGGPSGALALFLVLGLVVGIWLVAGRDPGSGIGNVPEPTPSPTATASSSPASSSSAGPGASPTADDAR